jgi:hypothetical protein
MSKDVHTFQEAIAKALGAYSCNLLDGSHFERLDSAHKREVLENNELLTDCAELIELVEDLRREFDALKSELSKGPSGYYVGLSVGIMSEVFREYDKLGLTVVKGEGDK